MKMQKNKSLVFLVLTVLVCVPFLSDAASYVSIFDPQSETGSASPAMMLHNWNVVYTGFGNVSFNDDGMRLQPAAPTSNRPTSAALALSKITEQCPLQNFRLKVTATTEQQLRANNPNAWEVLWIVTNYRPGPNNTKTMNYFMMKPATPWQTPPFPGGAELGYAYDDIGQTFLSTPLAPLVPVLTIGQSNDFEILKQGSRYRVWVDGQLTVDYTDTGLRTNGLSNLPGAIGAYTEDARVVISDFQIQPLQPYDRSCYIASPDNLMNY